MIKKQNKTIVLNKKRKDRDDKQDDKIKRIEKKIKKIKIETKISNTGLVKQGIPTTGLTQDTLVVMSIGSSSTNERIGNQVNIHSIDMKYIISSSGSTAIWEDVVRWYLVQDKQPNGAITPITTILESANINSMKNWNTKSRIKILRKGTVTLSTSAYSTGNSSFYTNNATIDLFVKLKKPITVQYTGNTANISNVLTNQITLLFISSRGLAEVEGEMRAYFTDA